MKILDYDGNWLATAYRHPDKLTVLAPAHLQEECVRTGGRTLNGRPRFRLAWTPSRFQISGAMDVNHFDEHGNYLYSGPETVFVPRYLSIQPPFRDSYVLERWQPPEWYAVNGFGTDLERDGVTSVQTREPIWAEGGYEAVMRDFNDPQIFPRTVSSYTIYKAIRWTLISASYSGWQRVIDWQEQRREEVRRNRERREEQIGNFMGPFGVKSFSAYGQTTRR